MKLQRIVIDHYRSIEHIEIEFPIGKPVVLFGPNNAGKSNILSAIDRLLGERYPTYIEMLDSDFYMRNKASNPTSTVMATFTSDAYVVKFGYAYFGKDFETYFRTSMPEYAKMEKEAIEVYGITSKPGKAKAIAQHCDDVPEFITKLKNELVMIELLS